MRNNLEAAVCDRWADSVWEEWVRLLATAIA